MRAGPVRRGPGWRAWIAVLAIALAGAASTAAAWHEEHAAGQDCAVCQLRHQPAAETSGSLPAGPAGAPRPFEQQPPAGWVETDHFRRLPARAPPARFP